MQDFNFESDGLQRQWRLSVKVLTEPTKIFGMTLPHIEHVCGALLTSTNLRTGEVKQKKLTQWEVAEWTGDPDIMDLGNGTSAPDYEEFLKNAMREYNSNQNRSDAFRR